MFHEISYNGKRISEHSGTVIFKISRQALINITYIRSIEKIEPSPDFPDHSRIEMDTGVQYTISQEEITKLNPRIKDFNCRGRR